MDDQQLNTLVARIAFGDKSAFREFFDHFQGPIFNFLVYKLGDQDLAEDMLQETFLKVWKNRENLDQTQSIKSYLFTMANNAVLNHFRHQKVVYAHQAQYRFEATDRSPEEEVQSSEFQNYLLAAIENLPEKTRITFMMSRFENLNYKEISERTDTSIKTVESHIGKALRIIRDKLKEYEES
ncbi:MAG: RNA polymerase sigma-70 factor [Cyclobacteriaceae bacterium]